MRYLIFALFLSGCATTTQSVPPAFGFHGKVKPHRAVVCMIDADMTHERCDDVGRAVNKINEAVGYELLQEPTEIPLVDIQPVGGHSEVILVGVDVLQRGVLGVTAYKINTALGGYLAAEMVVFDIQIWKDPLAVDAVILHELIHAIGAGHADQESGWESVMRPAYQPGAPINLTPADLAAIRAAYR